MDVDYTYSLTFGDVAENHHGMKKHGTLAVKGLEDFSMAKRVLGDSCEVTDLYGYLPSGLTTEVYNSKVVVIRGGVDLILGDGYADKMLKEQRSLPFDTKCKMRGRVVNKRARWNSCFDDEPQEPDYEEGKGTVISFDDVPVLNSLRGELPNYFGDRAKNLKAEMNYYYDIKKCGIGYHGDSERRIVICVRLGATIPLCYQWYYNRKRVGEKVTLTINHGDIYAMSEKAVGSDWRRWKVPTLRHAAGCDKYTK